MSRYGVDYYGIGFYGSDNVATFTANPFVAQSFNYNTIKLTWADPVGTWAKLILVRNQFGFPLNPYDGTVLVNVFNGNDPTLYTDVIPTTDNTNDKPFFYYSIFVLETTTYTWKRAGNTIGTLVLSTYNNQNALYNNLPDILKIRDTYDAKTSYDNADLKAFLNNFAFQLDYIQTFVDETNYRYDLSRLHGNLLQVQLKEFGLTYEPEVGYQQSRVLARNALHLYKEKGARLGLLDFIKSFSGYGVPNFVTGTVTYTAANSFYAGDVVTITGIVSSTNTGATAGSGYNLTNATVYSATSKQFTILSNASGTYASGGTATDGTLSATITNAVGSAPQNPPVNGVQIGHNLMLDYNDSSFEESIGHWYSYPLNTATLTALRVRPISQVSLTANVATLTVPALTSYAGITNAVGGGTTIVYTAPNSFMAGQSVTISGVNPSNYNITGTILSATATTFTVTNAATGTYVSGGTAVAVMPHGYQVGNALTVSNCSVPLFNTSTPVTITAVTPTTISYTLTAANVVTTAVSSGTITPSPFPWNEPTALSSYPNKQLGILGMTNPSVTTANLYIYCGINPVTKGVPVTSGLPYTFSFYSTAGTTPRVITAGINWYDRFGQYISGTQGTGLTNSVISNMQSQAAITNIVGSGTTVTYTAANSFVAGQTVTITGALPVAYNLSAVTIATANATSFTVTNGATGTYVSGGTATATVAVRPVVTAPAPASAYYAAPSIEAAAVAGSATPEWHYFDAAQFEQSSSVTPFDEARQLHITVKATRINELVNPHLALTAGTLASPTLSPWAITGATAVVDNVNLEPSLNPVLLKTNYADSWKVVSVSTTALGVMNVITDKIHYMAKNSQVSITNAGYLANGVWTLTGVGGNSLTFSPTYAITSIAARATTGAPQIVTMASNHGFEVGQSVTITGSSVSGTNVSGVISAVTATTFTIPNAGAATAAATGGVVTFNTILSTNLASTASITAIASTGSAVTYTAANTFLVGQQVTVSGATIAGYNGTFTVTVATASSFTVASAATGATSTASAVGVQGNAWQSGNILKLTATGTSSVINTGTGATLMPIYYPLTSYTFSIYGNTANTAQSVLPQIVWYDINKVLISTSSGSAFTTASGALSSVWSQLYVTAQAPATAAYAMVQLTWTSTNGAVLNLDQAMLENSSFVNSYFDGSHGLATSSDLLWEGGSAYANTSRSHFYKNRFAVQSRIGTSLSSNLTYGTTLALYLAQPQT
jgi:hypothetical protein